MEKYEIVKTDGGFRARFKGANGEIVWWTETYNEERDARAAITLIQMKGRAATFVVDERTHP
jgi:uncharacterized protein YegP (UPF0339 family)